MYVYIQSEPHLWTTGFYAPDGTWHPDSDHSTTEEAATRAHWLNGGHELFPQAPEEPCETLCLIRKVKDLTTCLANLTPSALPEHWLAYLLGAIETDLGIEALQVVADILHQRIKNGRW